MTVCALLLVCVVAVSLIASKAISEAQTSADSEWKIQITPVAETYQYGRFSFSDAAILDGGIIWVVGYDGHDPERIYYSKDGGRNWENRKAPTEGWSPDVISFADQKNGWAVGSYGPIIRTSDGGLTWERIKHPTVYPLNALHFVSPTIGYVAGRKEVFDRATQTSTFGVIILKTTDGGQNWQTCYEDNDTATVWQIAALSEEIAVAVMDGKYLLRTEDAGSTWQVVSPKVKTGFLSVAFTAEGKGWAVGEKGALYHSLDQAKTWQKVTKLPEVLLKRDWWSIGFAADKRGLIVGKGGAVALTKDGGLTWTEVDANIAEDLRLVRLHNGKGLIAGSQRVYQISSLK
jgi:photosystem II stability/assembly factor-like uncharacterized protein